MYQTIKNSCGVVAALFSLLTPVRPLIVCAIVFVGIDFITGVVASYKRASRKGVPWAFESQKAWRTILKLGFVLCGIVLAWLIDVWILPFMHLHMANLFTGFVCGVEFWSYLENAADISNHPVFRWLKKYMKDNFEKNIKNESRS